MDVNFTSGELVEIANEIEKYGRVCAGLTNPRASGYPDTAEECARRLIPMVFKLVRTTSIEWVAKEYFMLGMSDSWPQLRDTHPDIQHAIMLQVDGVLQAAERLFS
jgi:hypothetical protein